MKIALITAIREDHTLPDERYIKRIATHLAPMYLASYLAKYLPEAEVLIKDNINDFNDFKPDILGISSVTENIEYAKWLAKKAKLKWGSITVLGGVHISALPHALPAEFDFGVKGEGEQTLLELAQKLLKLKASEIKSHDFGEIAGLIWRKNSLTIINPQRANIANLDDIPMPDRSQFVNNIGMPYMMTSRGCPYTCSFCVIPFTTTGYRMHSPEYVVNELKQIKLNYPDNKHIYIFDDLFIVHRNRVEAIADLIVAEGLDQELSFSCLGRANLLDDKMIATLKKMNMKYVAFGAESGSSRVVSQIKPGSSVEMNQQAIDRLSDAGIQPLSLMLLGHPEETEADLYDSLDFLVKNQTKLADIELNVAIPWPGTDLWRQAKVRGLVADDMDFSRLKEAAYFKLYNPYEYPYLNQHITPERFVKIINEFKDLLSNVHHRPMYQIRNADLNPSGKLATLK